VYLGAFVDDPYDWKYVQDVGQFCAETCLRPLHRTAATLRSLTGLVTGQPLSIPYYHDKKMRQWVDRVLDEQDIHQVLVFSSAMAQYVENRDSVRRVIDFVDVDSDKWRQYAEKKSWPANWVYGRESERLLSYERGIAERFDRSVFVSAAEADLFCRLAPESADRVSGVANGVDTDFFRFDQDIGNPYLEGDKVMVFTGAMDYWANVDAVTWFAEEVFPEIRRREPAARFFVVGARPTEAVQRLQRVAGVTVTGGVKDIRPYISFASFAVAPLRIARGIQNKVLEALAMGKPVLATSAAMEGIEAPEHLDMIVADSAADWVESAIRLFDRGQAASRSARNRAFVESRYGWQQSLGSLVDMLESG
jgi:sugar transferase (PEP-CTERM/EpsH1 system associated)